MAQSIKNRFFNIHNNTLKHYLTDENISHYSFTYDLLEYDLKNIYQSFNVSYFTRDNDLLNRIYDLNELRSYESIIDGKNQILIKKFKLRCSIDNNSNFSDEIIVSEECMLDFANFNHVDSLIKIAIVHEDDVNNWINSGNLDNYDFIFTNNENLDLLKQHNEQVFLVNGETIYVQLKNILNLLYMRKKEKFYFFINNKFNHAFPNLKNYFKIFHSEFFDEEWYRTVYNIPDNTDPVIHYIMIGNSKGYNPGPNFDSWEYYEINSDVKSAGINPLLHYESYGKKENRQYQFSEEKLNELVSFISNSPYFDSEWYEENYDISDYNLDPATHYLKVGFKYGYNPGPEFDTREYYRCSPDVKVIGMNPLLHYEKHGRKENRVIRD